MASRSGRDCAMFHAEENRDPQYEVKVDDEGKTKRVTPKEIHFRIVENMHSKMDITLEKNVVP